MMIFFQCDHPSWCELENLDYCKNGNELDGVFCHTCKKEFVHKYSDDAILKKDQWKGGFGENIVHACVNCHTCGMAYCHACHTYLCNSNGRSKRKRVRRS